MLKILVAGHEVVKCSCGAVIAQCRCFSPEKATRIVEKGCNSCQQSELAELANFMLGDYASDVKWVDRYVLGNFAPIPGAVTYVGPQLKGLNEGAD